MLDFYYFNPLFARKKIELSQIFCETTKKVIYKKTIIFNERHISFNHHEDTDFLERQYRASNQNYQALSDIESDEDTFTEGNSSDEISR